MFIFVSGP
uniref:Uncharacterized protein n=1 Tax=Moniliophthora roreri TaxID=221103 RepID=A0A0W0GA39_MONRR